LQYRSFRYLLSGRFASLLGNGIAPIALAVAVLDLSGSATALGLIVACRTIPQVFLMLFGGVIADRFPRDRVIVVANSLGAATQGLAALLLITGTAELWQLGVIEAANGAVTAFAFPPRPG
jgi:MFS family permease